MKLYICQTIDGFIAENDGSIEFLNKYNELIANSPNEKIKKSYDNFMNDITSVVEGYKTFKQIEDMGYGDFYNNYNHYVLTKNHKNELSKNNAECITFDELINLNLENDKTFLIGGSQIIAEAISRKLISKIIIVTLPHFLGSGIKLFDNINTNATLKVTDCFNDNYFTQIEYDVMY